MKKSSRDLLLSSLYLLCLYLGVKLLPLYDWLKAVLLAVVFVLCVIEIRRDKINLKKENAKPARAVLLLPLLIACFSNILYAVILNSPASFNTDASSFVIDLSSLIVGVLVEEMIFRVVFLSFFEDLLQEWKHKDSFSILFSALTFSLMHAVNFYGNNPLTVLTQMGYTFVMGLLLGFIALRVDMMIAPSVSHFLYNFFQQLLYVSLFDLSVDSSYYIYSALIGAGCVLYVGILYFVMEKRRLGNHA